MTVKENDVVQVEYVGTFEDGTEFDASAKHGKPLQFTAGKGMVVKGFDQAVIGMKKDEEKKVKIKPEDGYGEHRKELIKEVERSSLPKGEEPKEGMHIVVGLSSGQQFPAQIVKVTKEKVEIDLNHPLAGKVLNFEIKVVGINPKEEKKA